MPTELCIDYNHVKPEHEAIHARLVNWERWVRVRPHGWATSPMFRLYQSKNRQWEAPVVLEPINSIDAMLIEKAVSFLPEKHRAAIRWWYVFSSDPARMARELALSKQSLSEFVHAARSMLKNTVSK